MKIGVVVDNELNSDKRVLREIGILREAGHEIYALCFGFGSKEYRSLPGIRTTRIRISKKLRDTLFFFFNLFPVYEVIWTRAIKKFILANNLDLLHVHDLYMSKAGYSGIKSSGKKIPVILDLHENYPYAVTTYNWTKGLLRRLLSRPFRWQKKEKEYLMYADRIVVLSEEFRDQLTGRYPELASERFTVFPNVPDADLVLLKDPLTLKADIKTDGPVLFYFGVVAERRGIFDALEVFTELVNEHEPLVFLIIGPVDKKDRVKFFGLIRSDKLREQVYYIPWIDEREFPAYLERADICLAPFHRNPQHESGVANKIYDYMLGAKPVVASDCRPQKILIEKYECGIVYSDHTGMKEAIKVLSADPVLRRKMGRNGYEAIRNEHNINAIKGRLTALYIELLQKP